MILTSINYNDKTGGVFGSSYCGERFQIVPFSGTENAKLVWMGGGGAGTYRGSCLACPSEETAVGQTLFLENGSWLLSIHCKHSARPRDHSCCHRQSSCETAKRHVYQQLNITFHLKLKLSRNYIRKRVSFLLLSVEYLHTNFCPLSGNKFRCTNV